jgi:glycine cleavage system H protein
MSNVPDNLKYTKDHEWVAVDGDIATIGITDHAQEALGDLVYVELPQVGTSFSKGADMVIVESCKAASDVYAPVAGEVVEVNSAVGNTPESVNADAYSNWLVKLKISNASELDSLLTANAYKEISND